MNLRTRLALLLAGLLVVSLVASALLHYAQHTEGEQMLADLENERSSLLDRVVALRGQSLASFASDYSQWDEMVRFLQTGDTAWAAVNLDASLPNFGAQAAWVAGPDGRLAYAAHTPGHLAGYTPPLADPAFLQHLRRHRTLRFFVSTPDGLLELRTGPVVPSGDVERKGEPQGWLVVGRLWDEAYLASLADAVQSRISLKPPTGPAGPQTIRLQRLLPDWRDSPVATLHTEYDSQPLSSVLAGNKYEVLLLSAFGLSMLVVTAAALSVFVLRPVRRLQQAMTGGNLAALGDLPARPDEFGELARQVADAAAQRAALRENEQLLRESIAVRGRLARDLHDGIIQSLYAAGLGLESVRAQRQADPGAAEQRLASCQRMLNDTIWQVRNFINALEPEAGHRPSASQSLASLAGSMQSVQSVPIAIDIPPAVELDIPVLQELQLLQISRELLSNALRHSQAGQVRIALRPLDDGSLLLEVADNGIGFEPAGGAARGRGLGNVAARAAEIGATLAIDSAPGKGTRVSVRFRAKPSIEP